MKWEYTQGDLLASDETTIAHGCNTVGAMGGGIAAQIAAKYPSVRESYGFACSGGLFVLGTAQPCKVYGPPPKEGDSLDERIGSVNAIRTVYNLGTQLVPGPDARYRAIELAFANMASHMLMNGTERVAIPRIGCGIGGLVWEEVQPCMEAGMHFGGGHGMTVAVYDFVPSGQAPVRKSKQRSLADLAFGGGVAL